jgi:hypothetical protein
MGHAASVGGIFCYRNCKQVSGVRKHPVNRSATTIAKESCI